MSIRVTIRLFAIAAVAVCGLLPADALKSECKGAGKWKRFEDISWPVTFAYPASWTIAQDNGQLTLTCPERDSRIYDYGIAISQGKRAELADRGFHPSGRNWVYVRHRQVAHCAKFTKILPVNALVWIRLWQQKIFPRFTAVKVFGHEQLIQGLRLGDRLEAT